MKECRLEGHLAIEFGVDKRNVMHCSAKWLTCLKRLLCPPLFQNT